MYLKRLQIIYAITGLLVMVFVCSHCKSNKQLVTGTAHMINLPVRKAKVDQLGNLIILTQNNKVYLYTKDLIRKYEYADNTLGMISQVDATNPLKIILYKKDYGLIITVDNTLSEIDRLSFFEMGFQAVNIASAALDGNLWIYDNTDYRLKKITPKGKVLLESITMVEIGMQGLNPDFIQEKAGKLILKDPEKGILLFDNLGQYIQTFPFRIEEDLQFDGNNLIFFEKNKMTIYDTRIFEESIIDLSKEKVNKNPRNVKISKFGYYYIYNDGIDFQNNKG